MRPLPCLALLLLVPIATQAADPVPSPAPSPKEVLVDRLEAMSYGDVRLSADSPLIAMLLQSARKANPQAGEDTWKAVGSEVATSYLALLTRKGGTMDQILRPSLEALSEPELNRLAALLQDPVYQKYKNTMQGPETQLAMQKAMLGAAMDIGPMLNGILEKHGLQGTH